MSQPRTLSDSPNPRRKFPAFAKRLIKGLAALAIFAVVGLTMLLALLWREHKTEVTLPAPAGHFAVGRATYAWVNNARTDELAPSSGAKREVVVWIWNPSAAATSGAPVEYLPAPWRLALAQHSGVLMSQFFTRDLSLVRAHSTSDPEVSSEQRSYPVVIMRAGGGALTTDYMTLTEDLASHGYIVVGFDAPYRTFVVVLPDNRVVIRPPTNDPENLQADQANGLINRLLPMWTSDTAFVVTQLGHLNAADPSGKFTGRLDMQRLGMFGHSFGGATALQFCHDDPRCKAGIDIMVLRMAASFRRASNSRSCLSSAITIANFQSRLADRSWPTSNPFTSAFRMDASSSPSAGRITLVSATRCYSRVITLSGCCACLDSALWTDAVGSPLLPNACARSSTSI